jgi:hypothetical protein
MVGDAAAAVGQPIEDLSFWVGRAYASIKGGVINEAYLMAIAKAKNPGHTLYDSGCLLKLPASRLEQLLFTLRNRIAAREGRGDSSKRNKGQG